MVLGCFVLYLILCGREGVFMCDLFKNKNVGVGGRCEFIIIGSCSSEMALSVVTVRYDDSPHERVAMGFTHKAKAGIVYIGS